MTSLLDQSALLNLAERLVAAAKRAGADQADAVSVRSVSLAVELRDGAVEESQRSESDDIGLRVLVGHKQAAVSTNDVKANGLGAIAERAVAMARAAPDDAFAGLADPALLARTFPDLDLLDPDMPSAAAPTTLGEEQTIPISRRCGPKTPDSSRYEPVFAATDRDAGPLTGTRADPHCGNLSSSMRAFACVVRLFKLIATTQWQGCDNRAATARREFRGVKWKPAGPLPGRAVRGRIVQARLRTRGGSTLFHCPRVLRRPTTPRTKGCALSICIANGWCCAARSAACGWL